MKIRFLDWQPDAADLGTAGNVQVTNCTPSQYSYQPFPQLSVVTNALTARPRGAIEAFDRNNTSYQYVGDATKLYELNEADLTWTDVTNTGGAYTTGSGEVWRMTRWENKVLATNFSDNPQQITMGAANFSDLTTAFKCRNITVIRDFVVASNTYDATDGNVPNRVRWSAIGDETSWTVSATTLADYRDLTTGGPIKRIIGGEVGIIVSERSIFRMTFVGAPVVFQIDEIQPDVGTISGGSVTSLGDSVYLISDQGFIEVVGNGTGVNSIGAGKVDQWFFDEYDSDYPDRIFSMADPTNNRILWCFPGSGNTAGRPNKIVVYDRTFGKWALVEEEVEIILRSKGINFTLDELDSLGYTSIDEMTISLDSNQFKVLSAQIGAFNTDFKLGFFRGVNKTATLETGEFQLNEGFQTQLKAFSPLIDGGTVTAEVGTRDRLSDAVTWGSSLTQSSSGRFTSRNNAKFHRIRLTVSLVLVESQSGQGTTVGAAKRTLLSTSCSGGAIPYSFNLTFGSGSR